MTGNSIRWRLRDVMESHGISVKVLSAELGVSSNTISNRRKARMPRIDGVQLGALLSALNNLRRIDTDLITPADLIHLNMPVANTSSVNAHTTNPNPPQQG